MCKLITIPAIAMLALVGLAAAKGPAKLKVCMDFGGGGNCEEIVLTDAAFDPKDPFQSISLCTRTDCASSAQLLAGSDVRCTLGNNGIAAQCSIDGVRGLEIVADGQ
jgi:hypothetical protein